MKNWAKDQLPGIYHVRDQERLVIVPPDRSRPPSELTGEAFRTIHEDLGAFPQDLPPLTTSWQTPLARQQQPGIS